MRLYFCLVILFIISGHLYSPVAAKGLLTLVTESPPFTHDRDTATYVRIDGSFPGGSGEKVRLLKYTDRISNRLREADVCIVDEDDYFSFMIELAEPQEVYLRLAHSHSSFFAVPGGEYILSFATQEMGQPPHPLDPGIEIEVECVNCEGKDTNLLISEFGRMVADYLDTYVARNIRANHSHSLKRFSGMADTLFAGTEDDFFSVYRTYYTAYLGHALNTSPDASLIESFIIEQPLHYLNPMYADFVKTLFESYIFGGNRDFTLRELMTVVNREQGYYSLMDILGRDTLLKDGRIRELAMLVGLQAMFSMDDFDNEKVLYVLKKAAEECVYREHSFIAQNIAAQYSRLKPGSPAPGFLFYDNEGTEISLEDFRGSYLYMFFWAAACPVSLSETGPAADLYEDMGESVSFLAVFVDREKELAAPFTDKDVLPFRTVHFGGDYSLLDQYRLRSIPQYVLIGPQGEIVSYPFVSPSAGAGERLRRITGR